MGEGTRGQVDTVTRGDDRTARSAAPTLFFLFVVTAGFFGGGVVGFVFLVR
jgi:hypothetical protein